MKTDPTFWILARSSGLLAYVLLTSSVLAGLVLGSVANQVLHLSPLPVTLVK